MSLDIDGIEVYELDRGAICNYGLMPHRLNYHNNLE